MLGHEPAWRVRALKFVLFQHIRFVARTRGWGSNLNNEETTWFGWFSCEHHVGRKPKLDLVVALIFMWNNTSRQANRIHFCRKSTLNYYFCCLRHYVCHNWKRYN